MIKPNWGSYGEGGEYYGVGAQQEIQSYLQSSGF